MSEIENPYNNQESIQARKDQEDPWIMYLIVNDDLNMSAGKIAAQVGHAVGMMYGYYQYLNFNLEYAACGYGELSDVNLYGIKSFKSWKNDSFRKVVLKAKNSKWEKLKDQLKCFVVRDAGLTEIDPGSETVIGVWPMKRSERPNILRKLQTL